MITEELLAKYENMKDLLPEQETFIQWLGKFRREEYSLRNKMLIFLQNPEARETR